MSKTGYHNRIKTIHGEKGGISSNEENKMGNGRGSSKSDQIQRRNCSSEFLCRTATSSYGFGEQGEGT